MYHDVLDTKTRIPPTIYPAGKRILLTRFFFYIGHYPPTASIDPLLLVRRKVRRYVFDFVGFSLRWLSELGRNLCPSYRTDINESYNDARFHRYLRMTKRSCKRRVDFMRRTLFVRFSYRRGKGHRFLYLLFVIPWAVLRWFLIAKVRNSVDKICTNIAQQINAFVWKRERKIVDQLKNITTVYTYVNRNTFYYILSS